MGQRVRSSTLGAAASRGFSMVELVVTLAVMMVLVAIAIPSLSRIFAIYQLNDGATRLANILKFTRFEAIRLNHPVTGRIQSSGTDWWVYADTNNNGVADPTESIDLITGNITLVSAAGMPGTGPITSSLGASGLILTVLSGVNSTVTFDARGAVVTGGGGSVYVLYLANTSNSAIGYRAIVLLPSGMVHVWTAGVGGVWQQVS